MRRVFEGAALTLTLALSGGTASAQTESIVVEEIIVGFQASF